MLTVLSKLGLLSEKPVTTAEGLEVVPLKLLMAMLPDPSSLPPGYTGKTCFGDLVTNKKMRQQGRIFCMGRNTALTPN